VWGITVDFEELVKQAEHDDRQVSKPAIPKVTGARRPVLIYIGESRHPLEGHIVESRSPIKLIHDYKTMALSITHVAQVTPNGKDAFILRTEFAHAKQDPRLQISFYGELLKTDSGYSGSVAVSRGGSESTQLWSIEYDD
jgi:hypothetical protein